ncbi:zinc transporter ZIP13-like [Dendroctonus ponderosae]|uniref:zinc transporter ZIP13-like n=1 Tax=Dendroctonus ponderosae TaxID=77166 RepID=UPI0020350300|nr:zinc transporter ZIP13-like [Dendroctonus ponderosae]
MVLSSVLCISDLNGTNASSLHSDFLEPTMFEVPLWFEDIPNMPWLWSVIGSILVGLTGVLPVFFMDVEEVGSMGKGVVSNKLKTILSFAVGALLADVFLHSLPEIYTINASNAGSQQASGMLILCGLITFIALEKMLGSFEVDEKRVSGYLNLLANVIDNFTHGLSLGGAFLVSPSLGVLTTIAILVHEIPHEVGDFAILLRSGLTRWEAAGFQLFTAGGGLVGAIFAIVCSGASNSIEARTSWILPFTAGSFLHIGLVTVLPDLLKEESPTESFKQMCSFIVGIMLISIVGNIFE